MAGSAIDRNDRNDGKITATIFSLNFQNGWAQAIDAYGVRYFCYQSNFSIMQDWRFEDLHVGSQVRLTPITGPKGPRGIEIDIVGV